MSKYDFEIDLSQNTSTGIILSKIKTGSVVLEFGCATGRMTRYMQEVLACKVYIVEYDKRAYEAALRYAEDGLCDDILHFQWLEKFKEIEFDAIIFADVLEHLTSPEKVLESASGLLKSTGCIYASIPNVTHNDILLKAYEEHFDYTETGLLDDTHVHFWGLKNIEMLSNRYGLNIRNVEGTYCPTGFTEQCAGFDHNENILLTNILKERKCGEVYQFIITLDKNDDPDAAHIFKPASIKSHIYLDTGNGFNEREIIAFDSVYSGQGSYIAHYVIENTGNIKAVRLDPIEFQGCILRHVSIFQGEEKLPLIYENAVEMEAGILLVGNDPAVRADVPLKNAPIIIDAEILILGEKYMQIVLDALVHKCAETERIREIVDCITDEKEKLCGKVDNLTGEKEALLGSIADLTGEKEKLREKVAGLTVEKEELLGKISGLTNENAELGRDLGAYILLVNNKDIYALELEKELANKKKDALELEQALNYYRSLRIVRLRAYIIRIMRGVKRRLKRVVRREEHE